MYGNPEVTTGGRALKFYASVRIDVRRIEALKNGSEIVGSRTRAKVVKNKVAPPFREAEFDIMYGQGNLPLRRAHRPGREAGPGAESGSWFSIGETRIGQGRDAAKRYLQETRRRRTAGGRHPPELRQADEQPVPDRRQGGRPGGGT